MNTITSEPRVGVAVIVRNGSKVLLGLRHGSHAAGEWALPGGSVDPGEHPLQTAARELFEESGLTLSDFRVVPFWSNDIFLESNKHFITLFLLADWDGTEPQIIEPEKCREWRFFDWDAMPQPLMCGTGEVQARFPDLSAL